jgi:hypothetical protein
MERIESGQLDKKEAERIGMQNRCINLITWYNNHIKI